MLQKQLDARIEEVKQLRRQLEAIENLDIGTLSEQLRQAKRECRMWRERAEAAEKRVAVFERFTAKIRKLKHMGSVENEETGTPVHIISRAMKVPEEEGECAELIEEERDEEWQSRPSPSERAAEGESFADRIRRSLQAMDGYVTPDFDEASKRCDGSVWLAAMPPWSS